MLGHFMRIVYYAQTHPLLMNPSLKSSADPNTCNSACVAGSMFGWYLVVDPAVDEGNTIVDVWVRWRGW